MKIINKDSIVEQYEKSGKLIYEATLSGDYKTNNREAAKLIKIFKLFEKDEKLAELCIPELLNSNNVVVKTKGAAYCLALGYNIETAEKILFDISENQENGIFGFNAKMTLQVWKDKGELTIYQHKK